MGAADVVSCHLFLYWNLFSRAGLEKLCMSYNDKALHDIRKFGGRLGISTFVILDCSIYLFFCFVNVVTCLQSHHFLHREVVKYTENHSQIFGSSTLLLK